ncbi:protein-tyrosine phosphatase family protein [Roseimaritima ulvae]|uniref:Tyrosine specific protein phosphatases domain-containing protein n=1 Tax=Roseimaritima ulvae TaxID=980254 RepID=A0A5B9QYP3_9BACT|nr:dual specificity protein phosphatase family protein [Roseimaritima ulvae]QEG39073.1 hypothetical protein UC8_10340 [Roseimaritima ulvae]
MSSIPLSTATPPMSRTYWVVDGQLLAGAYAGHSTAAAHRERLQGLFDAGVRTIVSLMEEDETNNVGVPFVPYAEDFQQIAAAANERIDCLRFPIVDGRITTQQHMREILDTIDRSIADGRPVFVHCFGGIGRTGTVVCCWLLRHGYATKKNVFETLQQLRTADRERAAWQAPENDLQRQFVLDWPTSDVASTAQANHPPASNNDWFTKLTGFSERTPAEVRQHITVNDDGRMTSKVNGQSYQAGRLEVASLGDLRTAAGNVTDRQGRLQLEELVGDAKALHTNPAHAGAMFQVASQFNLLEMVSPRVTPEQGVGIYEHDPTQGPACAIACGAGTIFRNYFVPLGSQRGQSQNCQVDCLRDFAAVLGKLDQPWWEMQNGYALPSADALHKINDVLDGCDDAQRDTLRSALRVGVQWNTQVTLAGCQHLVSQVYCSAMPVAYSGLASSLWEPLARLILEAAYEATLAAAIINAQQTDNRTVYLTLLGGGAFGNDPRWILAAIERACRLNRRADLDVKIVSYRTSNPAIRELVETLSH